MILSIPHKVLITKHIHLLYGDEVLVDEIFRESCCDEKATVYNFKVEDYHTYFVGENCVLVHNADYNEAVEIVSQGAKSGRETKGKTEIQIKDGDYNNAVQDFEAVNPSGVKSINTKYGEGKTGILNDGSSITARQGSSDGRPTLEVRKQNGRGTEFRCGK